MGNIIGTVRYTILFSDRKQDGKSTSVLHIKLTSVRYNTHACVSGFFIRTFSWCIIHPPFLSNHSHCVCIPSITSCNTEYSITSQQPSSYPLPILSLAIAHSCALFVQKASESKPHRHDTHYTHPPNHGLISREPQVHIELLTLKL